MIIIPAVDIKNGKCVRLLQGRMEDETVYSDDPGAMAEKWAALGAGMIHVIDLDGAFAKVRKIWRPLVKNWARLRCRFRWEGGSGTKKL